jgi:hypothetical protein
MNKIFLVLLAFFPILQVNAQTDLLTLAENKLHGPVRSVVTNVHWLVEKFGDWENASEYWKETAEFNKAGLLTASSKNESKFESSNSFSYNKKNQLTQWKDVFGKEGEKKKHYVRKYVYDANGKETEVNFYGEDGDLLWKEKKFYREDGLLKEIFTYSGDGDLITHTAYTYNDSKTLQSIIQKNSKKETVKTNEFEYDGKGNRVKEVTYDSYTKIKKIFIWTYDNGIRATQKTTIIDSKRERNEFFTFNKYGNEISLSDLEKYKRETVYTYDSHDNWITATFSFKNYEGKESRYRIVREIKYY